MIYIVIFINIIIIIFRCTRYTRLAPNCRLVDDFANPCCKVPRCDATPPTTTILPNPGQGPTQKPGPKCDCFKLILYSNIQNSMLHHSTDAIILINSH